MNSHRKRTRKEDVQQAKRIKFSVNPLNNMAVTTNQTTPEEEIKQLQTTINNIIPTINDIIKNGKKTTFELNKTNTKIDQCERSIKYLHKHVHRNSITIKNLGVDVDKIDETHNEIAKLAAHILKTDMKNIKDTINIVESLDPDKTNKPITIKVEFKDETTATSIIKNAKNCKDFVREDKSIKYKIFIQEYKSPIDAEREMELSHTIQLIYLFFGLLKKKDPATITPTVTKHYKKLKVNGTNTHHISALTQLTGFTEEQLIHFRHLKRTKTSTEELEQWIKKEQPGKF